MNNSESVSMADTKMRLNALLAAIHGLPEAMYRDIPVDIEAGEVGLAFEFICDQVDVCQVPLTAEARLEIYDLGQLLDRMKSARLVEGKPVFLWTPTSNL